jgi:transposase-like protein
MATTAIDRGDLAGHYARILAEQARSGVSVREAAWSCGVTPATLYAWRRRLRDCGGAARGLISVDVVRDDARAADRSGFEVVLRSGVTIRVPSDFDANALKELLKAVRAC